MSENHMELYEFTWPGKKKAILEADTPTTAILSPCREESKDWDTTENLYIEGDNLDALKLLKEGYAGKVKMIYIDPPYNTRKNGIYKDNFTISQKEYEDMAGATTEEDRRLLHSTDPYGRFHSDWCSMMYPRLKLARTLLSEDGLIFISIDDNEVHNLRKICDEVFGASNFIADLIWQKKFSRANDATYFSTMHDHILCYCKNNILNNENGWRIGLLPRGDEIPQGYSNPDNDPRGVWTSVALQAKSGSDKSRYEIITPNGRKCLPPNGRHWSVSQDTYSRLLSENRIWFGKDGNGTPRQKTFLSEVQAGLRPNTMLFHSEAGHNQEGKQETKALFNDIGVFDGPKPVRLLKLLCTIANLDENSIVLDFFSGSATTAHAVMQLNAEDGGKRKFIMVQLPEICGEDTEAARAGYTTICEIGKERIRRAGEKIKEEVQGTNKQIKMGEEPKEVPDIGFRVMKIVNK
jgi:adenine-specific DNA-methyltransferase